MTALVVVASSLVNLVPESWLSPTWTLECPILTSTSSSLNSESFVLLQFTMIGLEGPLELLTSCLTEDQMPSKVNLTLKSSLLNP